MTLTYIEPKGFTKTPSVGDDVFVFGRDGTCINNTKISAIEWFNDQPEVIHTDCGREWSSEGWFIGEDGAYPFPFISNTQ